MKGYEIVDKLKVRDEGRDHDVLEAIDKLPWVDQERKEVETKEVERRRQ